MTRTKLRPKVAIARRIERPTFVVGAERSGTTLLELMLDGHPEIAWAGEFEYAVDFISDTGRWPELAEYYEFLQTDRMFLAPRYSIDRTLDYPDLVNSFLIQKRDHEHKPHVGATVHRNFDRLLSVWPEAHFIHIVRDGRDVARSRVEMGWAGNLWTGSHEWLAVEEMWDRVKERVHADRRLEVRYEDLALKPVETLGAICAFFGVAYDRAMMEYPTRSTYSHPDPKMVEQWKKKLRPRDLALSEAVLGPMLSARGYAPSGAPSIEVTLALETRLRVQDRWARMRFRQRRYGLRLWFGDIVSRRIRWKTFQRAVQLEMNAVEVLHLK